MENAKKKNEKNNRPICGKHDVQSTGYRGNKVFSFYRNYHDKNWYQEPMRNQTGKQNLNWR